VTAKANIFSTRLQSDKEGVNIATPLQATISDGTERSWDWYSYVDSNYG